MMDSVHLGPRRVPLIFHTAQESERERCWRWRLVSSAGGGGGGAEAEGGRIHAEGSRAPRGMLILTWNPLRCVRGRAIYQFLFLHPRLDE